MRVKKLAPQPSSSRSLVGVACVIALALVASSCGTRLTSSEQASVRDSFGGPATADSRSALQSSAASSSTTTTTVASASGGTSGASVTQSSSGSSGPAGTSSGNSTTGASPTAGASNAPCGASGNQAPAGGNGGATATGVTSTTITVGNIASISGVAPGLSESAQQATEAWAAYVNSTGGICGRQIKVQPYDDGNTSGNDYADAVQACSSDLAMVGNASGFDDGSAQAVNGCGIPDVAAIATTNAAGQAADIFAASPGFSRFVPLGAANYLHTNYSSATEHAAMIYLNVASSQFNALSEVKAYETAGFSYVYQTAVAATQANYAPNVQAMQSAGVQYVTEVSDASSAERLLEAMQQANFSPQVVDWDSEEYSPQFVQQTQPKSNGDLVNLDSNDAYSEASSNPGMELMETWMNRVSPGWTQNLFAPLAWSAGMAFAQAAEAVGPNLTRQSLISQLQKMTTWTGGGVTPPINLGQKLPSKCFAYFKIENGGYQRVYPAAPNTFDCSGALYPV
jgi:ABC-type branched-subunit amino acid transport system substrate-binding protein